jgi:NAD/NADP transhydrogenase beta subunit
MGDAIRVTLGPDRERAAGAGNRQCQLKGVAELYEHLQAQGGDVKFAIHPIVGRMPGHINASLAEGDVP